MEAQWSFAQIAARFGIATADAARMAVNRALKKLAKEFNGGSSGTFEH